MWIQYNGFKFKVNVIESMLKTFLGAHLIVQNFFLC